MTDTTKTEALRLADAIDPFTRPQAPDHLTVKVAADELRRLSAVEAERDELREHLQFVERWAVHHGTKPHMTAEQALSVIQHYPPISDITKSYVDGKVPDAPNPWAERDRLAAECEALRADAAMLRFLETKAHWDDERDMAPGGRWWAAVLVRDGRPTFRAAITAAMGGKE